METLFQNATNRLHAKLRISASNALSHMIDDLKNRNVPITTSLINAYYMAREKAETAENGTVMFQTDWIFPFGGIKYRFVVLHEPLQGNPYTLWRKTGYRVFDKFIGSFVEFDAAITACNKVTTES